MAETFVYPNGRTSPPYVSDPFGMRWHPIFNMLRLHTGTDSYGHPNGYNYAPASGMIVFCGYNGGAGNQISIQDYDGNVWRLKHNANLYGLFVGLYVNKGQALAPTGTTGDSTGIHCHTECSPVGGPEFTDPFAFIAARISTAPAGGIDIPSQGEEDMPLTTADAQLIWSHQIANQGGKEINGKQPVFGRAADWITNMSDALARVEGIVAGLKEDGFSDEQIKVISNKISDGLALPIFPTTAAIADAVNDEAAKRLTT